MTKKRNRAMSVRNMLSFLFKKIPTVFKSVLIVYLVVNYLLVFWQNCISFHCL